MRVLLAFPPHKSGLLAPPLGLAYIAAVLEQEGQQVRILDFSIEGGFSQMERALKGYDLVGIGFMTPMFREASRIARVAKGLGAWVVVGGPHATALPQETLEDPHIDVVVRGEGETTILELVRALEAGEDLAPIRGISYRRDGQVVHNEERGFLWDLDGLPLPARHLLRLEKYRLHNVGHDKSQPVTSLVASRGCPGRCTYCASHLVSGYRIRFRDPVKIVEELEEIIRRFGIRQFDFLDDTFTLYPDKVIAMCEEILRRGLDIVWVCQTKVTTLSNRPQGREMLLKMKEAGCARVSLGIESASPRMLKAIKKGTTIQQVEKALALLREVSYSNLQAFFMVGNPGEDLSSVKETMGFLRKHRDLSPGISIATPFPGTEMYEVARENNHLRTTEWSQYRTTRPRAVMRTEALTYRQVENLWLLLCLVAEANVRGWPLWLAYLKKALHYPTRAPALLLNLWRLARLPVASVPGVEAVRKEPSTIEA